jgi:alanine-glyoxylate transaminase/serine-glyoxylate transaminase/serine-pyruvate transaminase
MDFPTIDHRGPAFAKLGREVLTGMQSIFRTRSPVVIYPSSGTGAWEAALVNTLSLDDKVVMVETGHFASMWQRLGSRLGLDAEVIPTDWRRGVDPGIVEERLRADTAGDIKALCVVHNETSTGATSRIGEVREAIDNAGHPALFLVDTISGLACADYRHDDWGVDVSVSGSQKGLMLPPGLSFNALSDKAIESSKKASLTRAYWAWEDMVDINGKGYFPYTPATNLLYGLAESITMLHEEGLDSVFARHLRHAEATRRAVAAWGLETQCVEEKDFSPVLTGVRLPEGYDADQFRAGVLDKFDMSLGNGLSKIAGRVFRIGHLGDINDLTLIATLSGVEMGLAIAGIPHRAGGVACAMEYLKNQAVSGDEDEAA